MTAPTLPAPRLGHRKWLGGLLLGLGLAATSVAALGPSRELWELSAKDLAGPNRSTRLPAQWRYHPGDDPSFAAHGCDDSAWEELDVRFGDDAAPAGWAGLGWFRLRFLVDPDLEGKALSLTLRHYGAAEIYLDGELLYALGTVDADRERAVASYQRQPYLFAFDDRGEHVLAVRYSSHDPARYGPFAKLGFVMWVGEANHRIHAYGADLARRNPMRLPRYPGVIP